MPLTNGSNAGASFTGSSAADFYDGALNSSGAQTLTSGDQLSGGAGTDSLTATILNSVTPSSLSSIEALTIDFRTNANQTLSLANASGVTSVANEGSAVAGTVSNIEATSVSLAVKNTSADSTFAFKSAVVTGSANAASLTVDNVTATAGDGANITIASVETINLVSDGSASDVDLIAAAATTVNVSGAADLTLDSLNGDGSTAVTKIDASTFSGALTTVATGLGTSTVDVTVLGGTGNDTITADVTNDVSVAGGAGNDTITMNGTLTATDTVAGGEGTDTLKLSAAVAVGDAAGVSGIETVQFSATATQDMDAFSATEVTRVNSAVSNAALTINDASAAVATLGISVANNNTVTFARKVDTTADSLSVAMGASAAGITVAAVTANDIEALTLTSAGGANTITTLTGNDLTSITVTGSKNLVVTDAVAGSTVITTVNASAATGAVDIDISNNTVAATLSGGTGNDSLAGGAGNDVMTGGAGDDTLAGNNGRNSIDGGAGNDVITAGTGNDTIIGGEGNDNIDGGTGNDSITAGAGNDTITFNTDGDLTVNDVVDGGEGTDNLVLTTATAVAPTLTSIETIDATITGAVVLNLAGATSLTRVDIENGSAAGASLTNVVTGVTVRIFDADVAATIDTAAGASLTIDAQVNTSAGVTVTDAAAVTLKSTATTDADDLTSVALDDVDTTSLTITGSTNAAADLDTGAISGTNALATVSVSSSTSGAAVIVDTIADADALTSLTVVANYGNVTMGAIGGTGTAEALASITVSADNGATADIGDITADTTDSTTDNAMIVTATAAANSIVELSDITNTYGTISLTTSGAGEVSSDQGTDALTADDITITAGAGGTYDSLVATDDVTITATNSTALTFSSIDTGATSAAALNVTASGSAAFAITTVVASAGVLNVDGGNATGTVNVDGSNWTGAATLTGGAANDTLIGGSSNDIITGGAGDDSLTGGNGNDTISGGAGNDNLILGGTGNDSVSGGDGNDTFTVTTATDLTSADTLDGGDGTDTLAITLAGATVSATTTNIETVNATFGSTSGGALNAGNVSGMTTLKLASSGGSSSVTAINIASGATVNVSDADTDTVALDTASGASLNVRYSAVSGGTTSITDAVSVSVVSGTADGSANAMAFDDTDTTSITVSATTFDVATGNITSTSAVTSVSVSTTTTGNTATVGTLAEAEALTSLTVTARNAAAQIGNVGGSAEAVVLSTVSVTADGADATVGTITADTTTDSTTDLAMTLTVSATLGNTATVGAIDNQYGTVTYNLTGAGTLTTGAITAADATINAGNATGSVTVDASVVAAAVAATFGTGTNTYTAGLGADTVTLAAASGVDEIRLNGDSTPVAVEITNFQTGGVDKLSLDMSVFSAPVDGNSAAITHATAVDISEITGDATAVSGDNIFVLTGAQFATTALLEAALEDGGSFEITGASAWTANEDIIVVWSDGSNSYVGAVNIDTTTTTSIDTATVTVLATLVGVDASVAGTLTNANFDFIA